VTSTATPAPSAAGEARAPSSTPTVLRRLRTVLVALAVLAGAAAALLTIEQHAVSSSAGEHTATAVMQAYAARQALVDADSQAVQTIPYGAGPSGQYQDDIAAAAQSLEQVAENNTAGAKGTSALQLLEGLLSAYTGLIEQADAHYRMQGGGTGESGAGAENGVGVQYLWSASELMHSEILTDGRTSKDGTPEDLQAAATGCLEAHQPNPSDQRDSLADLQCLEQQVLASQRSSPWVNPWLFAGWVVVALVLVIALVVAQRQFSVRLRRLLSSFLTLAAATVVGLGLVTAHVLASEHAYDAALSGPFATVLNVQDYQTAQIDGQGQSALANSVIGNACDQCARPQQEMAQKRADSDAPVAKTAHTALNKAHSVPQDPGLTHVPGDVTDQQRAYEADTTAAGAGYVRSLALIVALTALLVVLIFLGFRRHLDEYRYQSS
jgi:hypothetical protein